MKEKLLTIILFLIFMFPVGMADNIFMPSNSLPYNIFKTGKLWQVMWLKLLKTGKEKNNGKANIISWFKYHC